MAEDTGARRAHATASRDQLGKPAREKASTSTSNSGKAKPKVSGSRAEGGISDAQTFASALGEITWLLTVSPAHRDRPIHWLEKVVFPALLLQQFEIKYDKTGRQPVAAAFYGLLSDEHKAAWEKTGEVPPVEHWRTGEHVVVFERVVPFALAAGNAPDSDENRGGTSS